MEKVTWYEMEEVDLPNGMNLDGWGPVSVGRNDSFTLEASNIEQRLRAVQADQPLKFKIIGDFAFTDTDIIVPGGGKGIAAIREPMKLVSELL